MFLFYPFRNIYRQVFFIWLNRFISIIPNFYNAVSLIAVSYTHLIPLPYGTYIVRETTTPHNYKPVEDFEITIRENNPDKPQVWKVLLDKEFSAKLKIIKKDDETKKPVLVAGTEFKIYDLDHKKYVEQVTTYPTVTVHKSFFTDSQGYLILSLIHILCALILG